MCFRWKSLVKIILWSSEASSLLYRDFSGSLFLDTSIEQRCIPFKNSFGGNYNLFVIYSCVDLSQKMLRPNIQSEKMNNSLSERTESGKQLVIHR